MGDYGPAYFFVLAGLIGGIVLFVRGLIAYKRDRLISSVATSSLDAIAAGEVRVSGVVEAGESALVSPLQSVPCVWYRSRVDELGENGRTLLNEERAQGFRVVGPHGSIRVVPRGARWEIGTVFDESDSFTGDAPVGLRRRAGSTFTTVSQDDPSQMSESERQAAVHALLTVQQPVTSAAAAWETDDDWLLGANLGIGVTADRRRRYREARLEPGDTVTIIGQALPWGDVRSTLHAFDPNTNVEFAIAEDVAAARELGTLAASPEEAWGNAAIPGFGIGKPTSEPELDERATPEPVTEATDGAPLVSHDIPDDELVVSRGERGEMALYEGAPDAATMHHDFAFVLGVAGAFMAVFCVLALGAMLTGTL